MVVALGPGKFYGSSLPRPRFYTDVKFSDTRVDPPVPVLDPLLSWAEEAHWSMGGLSHQRLRMQGRIEGNVQKLRKEKEKIWRRQTQSPIPESKEKSLRNGVGKRVRENRFDSPPPAPISKKRRSRSMLVDEEEDEDDVDESEEEERENGGVRKRRRLVRKLGDDFELVAPEKGKSHAVVPVTPETIATRTRSRRSMVVEEEADEFDDGAKSMSKKARTESKSEKANQRKGSVSPNGSGSSGNGTPSRSSPRLKKKSS